MIRRVLESIKAGKRLPEAPFANLSIAAKGQKSVYGLFTKPFHDPDAVVGSTGSNRFGPGTTGSSLFGQGTTSSNGGSASLTMISNENALIG